MVYFLVTSLLTLTALSTSIFKIKRVSFISFLTIGTVFSLIFGFRDGVLLSTDLQNYKDMYSGIDVNYLNWARIEPGYLIYQAFFRLLGVSPEKFMVITSFIQMFSLTFLLRYKLKTSFLVVLIFISTPYLYNFSANTIRQGLAFIVIFYACVKVERGTANWWLLAVIGASFHFSVLVCFMFVAFVPNILHKKNILLFILVCSFFFFFLPLKSFIFNLLTLLPEFSSMGRSIEYALGEQEQIVTGRLFYLVSYIISIIILIHFERINGYVKVKYGLSKNTFNCIYSLFYFGVITYPIFSGIGYLLRFSSYGLALFPLFLYFLFTTFFSKSTTNIVCVLYLAVYFFYTRNLFIFEGVS